MIKREEGFTLVELMITMVVFVLVIAAASSIFSSLLNQFKQQSKIIETNVEGLVGLEMMRVDLQEAGFGLPWFVDSSGDARLDSSDLWTMPDYNEASEGDGTDPRDASYYNDGKPASALPAPSEQRAPRALLATDGDGALGGGGPLMETGYHSDYLVVKSTCISLKTESQKWTSITDTPGGYVEPGLDDVNRPDDGDWVIAERPTMSSQQKVLVMPSTTALSTKFSAVYKPDLDSSETHLIYDLGTEQPRAPFNRADFYVKTPDNMPDKCAPNTGILYKRAMINKNKAGGGFQELPLLDCVADMQVVFLTFEDTNNNGTWDPGEKEKWENADYAIGLAADEIRKQIRGVAVYILAQEGQIDRNFAFKPASDPSCTAGPTESCMLVGPADVGRAGGFDLRKIPDFANYRWKVYQFAVYPPNLR